MATAGFLWVRLFTPLFRAATTLGSRASREVAGQLESPFNGVLVAEQALSPRAVETFNNNLVAVNVNRPSPDSFFVVFHLFGNRAHELAHGVNLQQLRLRLL